MTLAAGPSTPADSAASMEAINHMPLLDAEGHELHPAVLEYRWLKSYMRYEAFLARKQVDRAERSWGIVRWAITKGFHPKGRKLLEERRHDYLMVAAVKGKAIPEEDFIKRLGLTDSRGDHGS